jgi:lactate racemase
MVFALETSQGLLPDSAIHDLLAEALARADLRGRRVLVLIPDGTRSGPVGLFYRLFCRLLAGHVSQLDFMIALGTHQPLDEAAIRRLLRLTPDEWRARDPRIRIFNHEWWLPEMFYTAGVIPADEIAALSGGRLRLDVPVTLNRRVLEYDQLILCGPVFPHEVAGFSGGTKYLFPGIAGPEIIDLTHWLGALVTSMETIGRKHTAARTIIDRAAELVARPKLACCYVVEGEGVEGVYFGPVAEAWERAADHAARTHVVYLDRPVQRALSVLPAQYDDFWTGAKGVYKVEPVVADGGEVIVYAPHIGEVSFTHGKVLDEIGYHVRDYFTAQWERFERYPWGVLAHSTHVRGLGTYDARTGVECPRIRVTLATGISPERCARIYLGFLDPRSIRLEEWLAREDVLFLPKAGEQMYRLRG